MDEFGIGVVGCGASVWMHGPALARQENAKVVAWMDPSAEAAQRAVDQYGGALYTNYEALLAHEGLDAVIIASPTWLHLPQTLQAARAGKHVFCEKPMARTTDECRQMIAACQQSGVVLMVGFVKRFDPALLLVKQMIASGELGDLLEIQCDWGWPQYFLAGWRDTVRAGGGLFQDHGSHTVDLCRWWAGEITSVFASVKVVLEGREVEDYAHVVCQHEAGCVSIHSDSRLTHRPLHECYRIEGSRASLSVECWGQWSASHLYPYVVTRYCNTKGIGSACELISPQPHGTLDQQMRRDYPYTRELRYFVEHLRNNAPLQQCRGEDGLAAIEVINAAYLSAQNNTSIALPLRQSYDLEEVFRALVARKRVPGKS